MTFSGDVIALPVFIIILFSPARVKNTNALNLDLWSLHACARWVGRGGEKKKKHLRSWSGRRRSIPHTHPAFYQSKLHVSRYL